MARVEVQERAVLRRYPGELLQHLGPGGDGEVASARHGRSHGVELGNVGLMAR